LLTSSRNGALASKATCSAVSVVDIDGTTSSCAQFHSAVAVEDLARVGTVQQCVACGGNERSIDVDCFAGRRLEVRVGVAIACTPLLCTPSQDRASTLDVDLVADDNKRELPGVGGGDGFKGHVSPRTEVLEGPDVVHIEDENTGICFSEKQRAKALVSLLASCVPHLHGHKAVIDNGLATVESRPDRCTLPYGELAVDILVHQRRFAHSAFASQRK